MSIARQFAEVRGAIEAACRRAGRAPAEVRLLAVSKEQPASAVEKAYQAGQRDFGENYVRELEEKRQALSHLSDIRWHLIGHLQKNKVKQALGCADAFQALDSESMVAEISKKWRQAGLARPWPVFIQVNLDDEVSKYGVVPADVAALADVVRRDRALRLEGLMCIPRPQASAEAMRPAFRRLAELARACPGPEPLKLSMGMSGDFEVAIEEGAHWVRVGRRLFGER